jgi:D-alanyl-D-alanine carboxypeptidase
MVTKSANDASVVLAEGLGGGSEGKFVQTMNKEARRLHMNSTVFCNASGWKNPAQLTTARDMAKLARALLREYPTYYRIFSTKNFHYKGQKFTNHNTLLGDQGGMRIDGIKTGYVAASGYNIAVSATRGTDRLIVVVLGGKNARKRNATVEWLLSCGFNKLSQERYMKHQRKSKVRNMISSLAAASNEKHLAGKKCIATKKINPKALKKG